MYNNNQPRTFSQVNGDYQKTPIQSYSSLGLQSTATAGGSSGGSGKPALKSNIMEEFT